MATINVGQRSQTCCFLVLSHLHTQESPGSAMSFKSSGQQSTPVESPKTPLRGCLKCSGAATAKAFEQKLFNVFRLPRQKLETTLKCRVLPPPQNRAATGFHVSCTRTHLVARIRHMNRSGWNSAWFKP